MRLVEQSDEDRLQGRDPRGGEGEAALPGVDETHGARREQSVESGAGEIANASEAGEVEPRVLDGQQPVEGRPVFRLGQGLDLGAAGGQPCSALGALAIDDPAAAEGARGGGIAQDEAIAGQGTDRRIEDDPREGRAPRWNGGRVGRQQHPAGDARRAEMAMDRAAMAQGPRLSRQQAQPHVEARRRPMQVGASTQSPRWMASRERRAPVRLRATRSPALAASATSP